METGSSATVPLSRLCKVWLPASLVLAFFLISCASTETHREVRSALNDEIVHNLSLLRDVRANFTLGRPYSSKVRELVRGDPHGVSMMMIDAVAAALPFPDTIVRSDLAGALETLGPRARGALPQLLAVHEAELSPVYQSDTGILATTHFALVRICNAISAIDHSIDAGDCLRGDIAGDVVPENVPALR